MAKEYHNIMWGRWELKHCKEHPAHTLLRKQACAQGWVGVAGFKDFVKEEYSGRLYQGRNGDINGIGFAREEEQTLFALSIEENT